jgi:hypothetical protein
MHFGERIDVLEHRSFQPGFRISALDVAVLVVGACTGAFVAIYAPWIGVSIGFVVAHFFLFCNVVRMARPLELTWAAIFVALAVGAQALGVPNWPAALGASLAATSVLVGMTLRKPSYHGAFWRQVNPDLPVWWAERSPTSPPRADERAS